MAQWARVLAGVGILGFLAGAVLSQWEFARAAGERDRSDRKVDFSPISGDPDKPRRHFRIKNPASLTPEEAYAIGSELGAEMASAYGRSGDPSALAYQSWERHNTTPYRSATHGQRYVNNYANSAARNYRRYEQAGTLPVGAVVAKDSFTVTRDGVVSPGPIFIMEKMPKGFNYVSGDWRYTMIMSDGSLFGVTNGENSERVAFCITCHLAREAYDHLFFMPEEVRIKR